MNDGHQYPPRHISDEALVWVMRLHSGTTGRADWEAFAHWRNQSAEHEAAAVEAETLWGETSHLHRDVKTGLVRPGRRRGPPRRAVLGGLAGVGVTGGVLWASGALRGFGADYATGTGETRDVVLADGSRVYLNARSALAADFSGLVRRVRLLEGQAFFDVATDAARPFEVEARGARITALGTAFDVDTYLPEDRVGVTVTRHSVRVRTQSSDLILGEEQRILVAMDGHAGAVIHQPRVVTLAWLGGMYVAEERPLAEVIAALRAYYPGWIIVQSAHIGRLPVNAVLDLRDPAQSLDALAAGLPIRVRRASNYLTVISEA